MTLKRGCFLNYPFTIVHYCKIIQLDNTLNDYLKQIDMGLNDRQ